MTTASETSGAALPGTTEITRPEPSAPRELPSGAPVDLKILAIAMRIARERDALSAAEVGDRTGLSPQTIQRAERGQLIELRAFVAIRLWLRIDSDVLLGIRELGS